MCVQKRTQKDLSCECQWSEAWNISKVVYTAISDCARQRTCTHSNNGWCRRWNSLPDSCAFEQVYRKTRDLASTCVEGMSACKQRKRAPKHKSIDFRKHLLRHECESEPGFVCTCQTYHRSRQRCTHLLNTTQYFHFLPSKACRSSKQAKVARGIYSPQNAAAACLAPIDTTINFRESNIHQKFIGQEEKCAEHQ